MKTKALDLGLSAFSIMAVSYGGSTMYPTVDFETIESDDEVIAVPVDGDARGFEGVVKTNETADVIPDLLK